MGSVDVVRVHFFRPGGREDMPLSRDTEYPVRVDERPAGIFRSPWDQADLDEKIRVLRHANDLQRPTIGTLKDMGKELGAALFAVPGIDAGLRRALGALPVLDLQLDYPELARIPWELVSWNTEPYGHVIGDGVSVVRAVPARVVVDRGAQWPTGRNLALEVLFVWGAGQPVPHQAHEEALRAACDRYGVDIVCQEVETIAQLTKLCSKRPPFHFVHILAHGTQTEDGNWGLSLRGEHAKPEQVARAVCAGGKTPALVTLSACDSAADLHNGFGSVAYQLHAYGIPFVIGSQFRQREDDSVLSVAGIYEELLGGGDLRSLLVGVRRNLFAADDGGWANEVVYNRYPFEDLEDLAVVARQQGVLRCANAIDRRARKAQPSEYGALIEELELQAQKLAALIAEEKRHDPKPRPEILSETCGLLASMRRRQSRLRAGPGGESAVDLRAVREAYLDGLRADANSHYCGINAIHLSFRLGEPERAKEWIPIVRFAVDSQIRAGTDFWAQATLADLEIYSGNREGAIDQYTKFVNLVQANDDVRGIRAIADTLLASLRPLEDLLKLENLSPDVRAAGAAAIDIVARAHRRAAEASEQRV